MVRGKSKYDETVRRPITQRLWWIVIAPLLWALHFLACYVTAAIWCEKYSSGADIRSLGWMITAYSVVSLTGILIVGTLSFWNLPPADSLVPDEFDDPSDRSHFLHFTSLLLAVLSGIATIFTVLVFVLVGRCD